MQLIYTQVFLTKINANTLHMNIQEAEIKMTFKVIAMKCI